MNMLKGIRKETEMERKVTWETYDAAQLKELEALNQEYRDFLDNGKTEQIGRASCRERV